MKEDALLHDLDAALLTAWMGELPKEIVETVPFSGLAIPGSHDSGAFYLNDKSPICPSESKAIRLLGSVAKKTVINWSITHHVPIDDQLRSGVRYFDMRTGYLKNKDDFFFVHGCYGHLMFELLEKIADFVSKHPREIIIVDFQHFHQLTPELHLRFSKHVKQIFEGKIYPYSEGCVESTTLAKMWEAQRQVILRYNFLPIAQGDVDFWPPNTIYSPWPNTNDIDTLLDFLEHRLQTCKPDRLDVFQAILTPQTKNILQGIFCCCVCPSKLSQLTLEPNKEILRFVEQLYAQKTCGVNIFMVDFVCSDFSTENVIKLNNLLLQNNKPKASENSSAEFHFDKVNDFRTHEFLHLHI